MGQRSQIYVRYSPKDARNEKPRKKRLVASYFQWNYGERMISRARYTLDWLRKNRKYMWLDSEERLRRIVETNFDFVDVVLSSNIAKEFEKYADKDETFRDFAFFGQDNNDGILLIDVPEGRRKMKYAFLGHDFETTRKVLDGEGYMRWDGSCDEDGTDWRDDKYIKGFVKKTERNIRRISNVARLMTPEEVDEFMSYDYERDMDLKKKDDDSEELPFF